MNQKKVDKTRELMSVAHKHIEPSISEYDKIALTWTVELQKMKSNQQSHAKKAIIPVLFDSQMGDLLQINCLTHTSVPFMKSPICYDLNT